MNTYWRHTYASDPKKHLAGSKQSSASLALLGGIPVISKSKVIQFGSDLPATYLYYMFPKTSIATSLCSLLQELCTDKLNTECISDSLQQSLDWSIFISNTVVFKVPGHYLLPDFCSLLKLFLTILAYYCELPRMLQSVPENGGYKYWQSKKSVNHIS